jgi:hypothetical protein
MGKGLANKYNEQAKAKAKAAKNFKVLHGNADWVTEKVIGKMAATSSVCGKSGCSLCSRKAYHSYTKKYYDSKVAVIIIKERM